MPLLSRSAGALVFAVALCSCSSDSGPLDIGANTDTDTDTDSDTGERPPALGVLCGGPDIYWEGGQRLQPIVHRPDDGSPVLTAWFDSELEVECEFQTASDGVVRCLPRGRVWGSIDDDPACDREIVFRNEWDTILEYGTMEECSGTEVLKLGPLFETPSSDDEAQGCLPAQYPRAYQVVLGVFPPQTFVSATYGREGTGSTMERRILWSDDGACSYASGWDSQAGGEVTVMPGDDGTMRFLPPTGYALSLLGDHEMYGSADCTGQAVGESRCSRPTLAAEPVAECGWTWTRQQFFSTEEPIGAESVYELRDECSPVFGSSDERYFYLGDPVPSSTFPVATAQLAEGRLQRRIQALPDGTALQVDGQYWDDDLQTLCTPIDGRCIPKFEHIVRFADDACAEPRLVYSTAGCPSVPKWAFTNTDPPQIYGVTDGEPDETTTTFYVLNGALECVLAVDVEPDELVLLAQGPVDREIFAAVERVVE